MILENPDIGNYERQLKYYKDLKSALDRDLAILSASIFIFIGVSYVWVIDSLERGNWLPFIPVILLGYIFCRSFYYMQEHEKTLKHKIATHVSELDKNKRGR